MSRAKLYNEEQLFVYVRDTASHSVLLTGSLYDDPTILRICNSLLKSKRRLNVCRFAQYHF